MGLSSSLCDVCGQGTWTQEVFDMKLHYRGRVGTIVLVMHRCNYCKGDYATNSDSMRNKQAVRMFRELIDEELDNKKG